MARGFEASDWILKHRVIRLEASMSRRSPTNSIGQPKEQKPTRNELAGKGQGEHSFTRWIQHHVCYCRRLFRLLSNESTPLA